MQACRSRKVQKARRDAHLLQSRSSCRPTCTGNGHADSLYSLGDMIPSAESCLVPCRPGHAAISGLLVVLRCCGSLMGPRPYSFSKLTAELQQPLHPLLVQEVYSEPGSTAGDFHNRACQHGCFRSTSSATAAPHRGCLHLCARWTAEGSVLAGVTLPDMTLPHGLSSRKPQQQQGPETARPSDMAAVRKSLSPGILHGLSRLNQSPSLLSLPLLDLRFSRVRLLLIRHQVFSKQHCVCETCLTTSVQR